MFAPLARIARAPVVVVQRRAGHPIRVSTQPPITNVRRGPVWNFADIPLHPPAVVSPMFSGADGHEQAADAPGQGNAAPVPADAPAEPDCHIEGARFTDIPSGDVPATLRGNRLSGTFKMAARFAANVPCNCHCGEYRQYIRGTGSVNDRPQAVPIGGNRTLDPKTFQEDGELARGTAHLAFGHRAWPGTDNAYKRDQEGGCRFEGKDTPQISVFAQRPNAKVSGTRLALALEFRADLIDTCRADNVLATATWTVTGTGTIA